MTLLEFKSNYRSQYGEGGIIKKIFEIIGGPKNKYFVEFGAWDGDFFPNKIKRIIYQRIKKRIKHFLFGKNSFFYLKNQ